MKPDEWMTLAKNKDSSPRMTSEGNPIYDLGLLPNTERYTFDFKLCKSEDGWQQYDTNQDAWYYGIWVHIEGRLIVTFCEGELSVVHCENDARLKEHLDSMAKFHGDPPPAFKVINEDGSVSLFYDERPTVEEEDGNVQEND